MLKFSSAELSFAVWGTLFIFTYLESVSPRSVNIFGRLSSRYMPLQWFVVWAFLGAMLFALRIVPGASVSESAIKIIGVVGAFAAIVWLHLRRNPIWPKRIRDATAVIVLTAWLVFLVWQIIGGGVN